MELRCGIEKWYHTCKENISYLWRNCGKTVQYLYRIFLQFLFLCYSPVSKLHYTCTKMIQYLYESCGIPVRNMYHTCTGWRKLVNFEAISGVSGVSPDQRAFCDTKCVSGYGSSLLLTAGYLVRIFF